MKRCLLFYVLLCLSGCAKEAEEYAPSSPQVCDYVASLGALPDEEVAPETSQKKVLLTMVSFIDDVYKIGSGAAGDKCSTTLISFYYEKVLFIRSRCRSVCGGLYKR